MRNADFVVVGSGIAGLTFALSVADRGRVVIVTKKDNAESATNMAQGGIAAVVDPADSFGKHIEDTLVAGVGLCDRRAVEVAVRRGPEAVRQLADWGARFSMEHGPSGGGGYALGQEGGHSGRRIVHAADMTGREIEGALIGAAERHPNIVVLEDHIALDLAIERRADGARRCAGVHTLDIHAGAVETVSGAVTVLATGGCGKVYLYTTNPDIATGDGVAMAFRAGVPARNMEFIQFHPTCLYHPSVKSFLISEAVRGEGAVLLTLSGRRIMEGVHPRADLAPRDIVARAIDKAMKTTGDKHVLLDAARIGADRVRTRFPNITARLAELGIDATKDPIPVVPAAHYLCGGIGVDLDCRTTLPGLLAMGETAHTGMHGANRLASNSLLEAVVFAERGSRAAAEDRAALGAPGAVAPWAGAAGGSAPDGVVIDHNWDIVRRLMWDYVGIVRTERRLLLARERMRSIRREVDEYLAKYPVSADLVELRNICLVGELIVRSALERKESRGLHFIEDYPERDDARYGRNTVVSEDPVV